MATQKTCSRCGAALTPAAQFCPTCGNAVGASEPTICPRCGGVNAPQARFCQHCGTSLLGPVGAKGVPNTEAQGQPSTRDTAPSRGGPAGQMPGAPTSPPWGQTALGGLVGFVLGSMLGGGRGFGGWGGGWGDHDDGWGGGDFGGGDFGGGGDVGGGADGG